jgi:predicted thioesterase
MEIAISVGTTNTFERVTAPSDSAAAIASGALYVFSTPSLVALFEQTAQLAIDPKLPEGFVSVGTEVSVKHLKATPIGAKVRCTVKVVAVEGKRISLVGEMWDETGRIGEGNHTRHVVNSIEFMERLK